MTEFLKHILFDQKGATAVEYGLIAGLIFMAIVGGVSALASTLSDKWNFISQSTVAAG